MLSQDIDYTEGLKQIWSEYKELQEEALKEIILNHRHVPESLASKYMDDFKRDLMVFIPSNDMLPHIFGESIRDYNRGLYNADKDICNLIDRLAIPLRDFTGRVFNFIGYDSENSELKYLYPPKHFWSKDKYMYITKDEYLKAVKDQYICIVDGIFDKRSLQMNGINAVSLCGSALTKYHVTYLSLIKHIIVIPDNDKAGKGLTYKVRQHFPQAIEVKQGTQWDIDDFLKSPNDIVTLKKKLEEALTLNILPSTLKL